MFLSCGRYQRNQLPGNTREFQTPPSLPPEREEVYIGGGWGVEGGGSRKGVERTAGRRTYLFYTGRSLRPGTDGILYQVAPQARRTPPFSFAAIDASVAPSPSPPYADTRQPSMPDDFQLRFNSLLLVFQELPFRMYRFFELINGVDWKLCEFEYC